MSLAACTGAEKLAFCWQLLSRLDALGLAKRVDIVPAAVSTTASQALILQELAAPLKSAGGWLLAAASR